MYTYINYICVCVYIYVYTDTHVVICLYTDKKPTRWYYVVIPLSILDTKVFFGSECYDSALGSCTGSEAASVVMGFGCFVLGFRVCRFPVSRWVYVRTVYSIQDLTRFMFCVFAGLVFKVAFEQSCSIDLLISQVCKCRWFYIRTVCEHLASLERCNGARSTKSVGLCMLSQIVMSFDFCSMGSALLLYRRQAKSSLRYGRVEPTSQRKLNPKPNAGSRYNAWDPKYRLYCSGYRVQW